MTKQVSMLVGAWLVAMMACDPQGDDDVDSAGSDAELDSAGAGGGKVGPNDLEGQPCDSSTDDARSCGRDEGTQYCQYLTEKPTWGPCVADPECEPSQVRTCEDEGSTGYDDSNGEQGMQYCGLGPSGIPEWSDCESGDTSTPLVIVPPGQRIELDHAAAASFELGNTCLGSDWPAAQTPWLALDRDGNGQIDGGHELFGSAVVLGDGSRARNGFLALAELDRDRNGRIDAADPDFARLRLWHDLDGDRRSSEGELALLSTLGLTSVPLAFQSAHACDDRGNCGVERAWTTLADGGRAEIVDLHLACQ